MAHGTPRYFYRTMWDPIAPEGKKIRYYILHAPKLNGQYVEDEEKRGVVQGCYPLCKPGMRTSVVSAMGGVLL